MTGLIQSFLSLYNNNAAFPGEKIDVNHKSPEIFNAFLLIVFFSVLIVITGFLMRDNVFVFTEVKSIPYFNLLMLYILLSNPAHMVEYIYLLRNKSKAILSYGIITYGLQFAIVGLPVIMGYGVKMALMGLIGISVLRLAWLAVLLVKYAKFQVSLSFIKTHLYLATPLIFSTLLSGSAQYIDGLVVVNRFDSKAFAVFRYGAKELPFVVLLANGLHSALLPEFSKGENLRKALHMVRVKSKRLINTLFPLSVLFLFFSDFIFPRMFNEGFQRSSDIFMVYVLLIISRLLFPNTVLIGLKKTRILLVVSCIIIILNIALSLLLIKVYGLVGVALATVIVCFLEKVVLIFINYFSLTYRHINTYRCCHI
ncbi:MAG: hypothetical protein HC896_16205 [Bacteroidales bacterium]|nr:hypothetical protein [Bacteroidales bacterium]